MGCLKGCNAGKATTCNQHIAPLLAIAMGAPPNSPPKRAFIDAKIAILISVLSVPRSRQVKNWANRIILMKNVQFICLMLGFWLVHALMDGKTQKNDVLSLFSRNTVSYLYASARGPFSPLEWCVVPLDRRCWKYSLQTLDCSMLATYTSNLRSLKLASHGLQKCHQGSTYADIVPTSMSRLCWGNLTVSWVLGQVRCLVGDFGGRIVRVTWVKCCANSWQ